MVVFNRLINSSSLQGFLYVAGGKVFQAFHSEELMHMVSGMQDFNFKDLESITEYQNGYHPEHPVIKIFWQMFHEMDVATKKNIKTLLHFWDGQFKDCLLEGLVVFDWWKS